MKNYRQMAINFSGALWVYAGICPQCGNKKDNHIPGCRQDFNELTKPEDIEVVFKKAFESE